MNIHYQEDRPGLTVLPDVIDEATGERVEGTSEIVPNHYTNFVESPETFDEVDEEAYPAPPAEEEVIPEASALDLADITEEVFEAPAEVNPQMADAIAQVDLGQSEAAISVQYLASKFYNGEMTADECVREAVESGIDTDALAFYYHKLKAHFIK